MENVTRALIIAFSMIIFVVGFSYSMYLINGLTSTANTLLETVGTTNYYDNIEISKNDSNATRDVGIDTVVSTLYRYYKESYSVRIVDNGELIQLFDMNIESKIAKAASYKNNNTTAKDYNEMISLKNSIYNKTDKKPYMFEAPWTGTEEDNRARINYFLNGTKGYINNTLVDYSSSGPAFQSTQGGFLGKYNSDTKFTENFVEYAYEGETISTENGLETITGSTQESSKIIITYTVKN